MAERQITDIGKAYMCQKGCESQSSCVSLCKDTATHYLLHLIDDQELTIQKLADNLEKIRMGLVYNGKRGKNTDFVIRKRTKKLLRSLQNFNLRAYPKLKLSS